MTEFLAPTGSAWIDWTWAFVLEPVDHEHTRFVFRTRGRVGPPWLALGYWLAITPADFVMSHQMMHGLKARAEREGPKHFGPFDSPDEVLNPGH